VSVRTGVWFFPDAAAPVTVDTIAAAEEQGIDEAWLGDEGPARDPFALLAAAARVTGRIRLGVGVTNPYLRHPASTAASAVTVHELSGGRAVLGIGPGGQLALGPAQVERVRPLAATRRAVRIIRAVTHGHETEGYTPAPHAVTAPDLPVYIGARGEQFNRFASRSADGVFLGGIPRSRLAATLSWARSARPIDAAVYINAAFDDAALEEIRPGLIYPLLDAPQQTRDQLGLGLAETAAAAAALAGGDGGPARRIIDGPVLDELLVHGPPRVVGKELAARVRALDVTSLGVALLTRDPLAVIGPAAEALAVARWELS
jgi:5,10-methylenetetrahydromethanopterin reductase